MFCESWDMLAYVIIDFSVAKLEIVFPLHNGVVLCIFGSTAIRTSKIWNLGLGSANYRFWILGPDFNVVADSTGIVPCRSTHNYYSGSFISYYP